MGPDEGDRHDEAVHDGQRQPAGSGQVGGLGAHTAGSPPPGSPSQRGATDEGVAGTVPGSPILTRIWVPPPSRPQGRAAPAAF